VIFTVTSRDQGFSWDRDWHGTYEHSWTWFNAVIFEPDPYYELSQKIWEAERIITNVHAGKEYKTHTAIWSSDSDNNYQQSIFKELKNGRHIGITTWARFGAWENKVANARIEFEVAVVTRG